MGGIAAAWFASPMLGVVIGAAMVINLIFAGFCGAGIPILIQLSRPCSAPAINAEIAR
jgi:magnesium transporter